MAGIALFNDGAAYERMMGNWSRLVGDQFLPWLAAPKGINWIDIGCGNGAFTRQLVEHCDPASVVGVDLSEPQLVFAREHTAGPVNFKTAGALALPVSDDDFESAVMALVLFFVPDPAKGVSEMRRVTRTGGLVSAYCWDVFGGGFPLEDFWVELQNMGYKPIMPPSSEASRLEAMRGLWSDAGLLNVETKVISVNRIFASFEEYWDIGMASSVGQMLQTFEQSVVEELKRRVRQRLATDGAGRVICKAFANAVKGVVPA